MGKSISWRRAGLIVILLHVGGFGLLMGYNNVKSKFQRMAREKEKERLLAKASSRDDNDWPVGDLSKRIVAYPQKAAKQITDQASSKPLQEAAAEKMATVLNTATSVKKEVQETYTDLQKLYLETTRKLETAKEETVTRAEKKIVGLPPRPVPKPVATPKPKPVQVQKPKPKPETKTVTRTTYVYKKPEPPSSPPDSVYEYVEEVTRVPRPSPQELDYNTIRYTYERIVHDPYTGRPQRVRVVGPMPIGTY